MMSLPPMDADSFAFHSALSMWDRPEGELGGQPLPRDADVDEFLDDAFDAIVKT